MNDSRAKLLFLKIIFDMSLDKETESCKFSKRWEYFNVQSWLRNGDINYCSCDNRD